MANWDCYQAQKDEKTFEIIPTLFVKAKTEEEAWEFIKQRLRPEGGLAYSIKMLPK